VINSISPQTVADGSDFSFTVTATSANGSPGSLTFSLGSGAPAGAGIDAQTGLFAWTPSEWNSIVPGVYTLTVRAAEIRFDLPGNADQMPIPAIAEKREVRRTGDVDLVLTGERSG
jgi:Putative Ig domain